MDAISERLDKELPGLKGFSARNLRNTRTFYEEWVSLDHMCDEELNLADTSAKFAGDSNRRLPAYRILASYFDLIKSEKHGRAGLLYSSKTWICSRSQKCEQAGSGGQVPTNRRGYELVVLLTRATSRLWHFYPAEKMSLE
ncbi:MAG: hypothetical protein J6Q00_04125 [Verrucomicrobia bacterium]|nr:hypothetical protein [Verrucomicrobiota bacterium]